MSFEKSREYLIGKIESTDRKIVENTFKAINKINADIPTEKRFVIEVSTTEVAINGEKTNLKGLEPRLAKISRKIANKFILVPIRQKADDVESIYNLNEVAARIWELIDGQRQLTEAGEHHLARAFGAHSSSSGRGISKPASWTARMKIFSSSGFGGVGGGGGTRSAHSSWIASTVPRRIGLDR